jgi:hypothetical protein
MDDQLCKFVCVKKNNNFRNTLRNIRFYEIFEHTQCQSIYYTIIMTEQKNDNGLQSPQNGLRTSFKPSALKSLQTLNSISNRF